MADPSPRLQPRRARGVRSWRASRSCEPRRARGRAALPENCRSFAQGNCRSLAQRCV